MPSHDVITHNFGWKLLSLLLAVLAWYLINETISQNNPGQSPVITTIPANFPEVPVAVMSGAGNPNHYRVTPENVSVEVSGTKDQLDKVSLRQVHAYVDITDAGDESQFRKTIQVQLAGDCKVVNVTPPSATVERISNPR
jgi:YbbR domain-containing protein